MIRIYKLFPLFFLFFLLIILTPPKKTVGDDARYLQYATNLSNGYYSDSNKALTNPPAYPIILTPIVYLGKSLFYAKILNAFFMIFAVGLFYITLNFYVTNRQALVFTYIFGLYPGILIFLPEILTETFSIFLVCCFIYFFNSIFQYKAKLKNILFASFSLAILILTKAVFGYVLIVLILTTSMSLLFVKKKENIKITLIVFILSIIYCLPYIFYTYSLTGKVFYLASNGGDTLYWLTTPYENEYGDWFALDRVESLPYLSQNHKSIADSALKLSPVEKDNYLLTKSMENIRNYPLKFIFNWCANIGRLFFNYPYSYLSQRLTTYFYFLPNMFLFVSIFICGLLSCIRWQSIPYEIKVLIIFSIIYLGGTSLLSAVFRYLLVVIPPILLWIAYVLNNLIIIKFSSKISNHHYAE